MRNRKAFLSLAVLAAAGLLVAMPAMAADPPPSNACTTTNGWGVATTEGLTYVPCASGTCTRIKYDVTGGTPDHVATFIRAEAGQASAPLGGSLTQTAPCGGESVIGVGANAVCHETIARFNNQSTKAASFTLQVNGRRKPITTSVVVKKGNSQGGCRIVGFGLEDALSGGDACVSSCGNFNANQSVRKVETFKFKNCEVTFAFDLTTGSVEEFSADPVVGSGASCTPKEGPISELLVNGGIISPGDPNEEVTFGDGWINSGQDSCTTRLVGGRYYSVCQ